MVDDMSGKEKNSMIFYYDWLNLFEDFSNDEIIKLIYAAVDYDRSGVLPAFEDRSMRSVFKALQNTIDINNKKYAEIVEKRRAAGRKGGAPVGNTNALKQANDSENKQNNQMLKKQAKQPDTVTVTDIYKKENIKEKKFTPPSADDVKAYCSERNNFVDAQQFVDFYTAKNWMIGKNKMKDWKAAVRTWERKDKETRTAPVQKSKPVTMFNNFQQRTYDFEALERKLFNN